MAIHGNQVRDELPRYGCKLRTRLYAPTAPWLPCFSGAVFGGPNSCPSLPRQSSSVKHHCQALPQTELVRTNCSLITFYFYVLSLEYPHSLCSYISSDCKLTPAPTSLF